MKNNKLTSLLAIITSASKKVVPPCPADLAVAFDLLSEINAYAKKSKLAQAHEGDHVRKAILDRLIERSETVSPAVRSIVADDLARNYPSLVSFWRVVGTCYNPIPEVLAPMAQKLPAISLEPKTRKPARKTTRKVSRTVAELEAEVDRLYPNDIDQLQLAGVIIRCALDELTRQVTGRPVMRRKPSVN